MTLFVLQMDNFTTFQFYFPLLRVITSCKVHLLFDISSHIPCWKFPDWFWHIIDNLTFGSRQYQWEQHLKWNFPSSDNVGLGINKFIFHILRPQNGMFPDWLVSRLILDVQSV